MLLRKGFKLLKMINKKGQRNPFGSVNIMLTAGILLVILTVVLGIGANLTSDVTEKVGKRTSTTVHNDTVTQDGDSTVPKALDYTGSSDYPAGGGLINTANSVSIASNGTVIGTADYTFDKQGGYINWTPDDLDVNVTYSRYIYGHGWAIGVNGTRSLADIGTWSITIAIIIAAIVIISLLIIGLGGLMGGRRGF